MSAIQVWVNNQHVGFFDGVNYRNEDMPAEIPILNTTSQIERYGPNSAEMNHMIWVPTGVRNRDVTREFANDISGRSLIDKEFRNLSSSLLFKMGIPGDAEKTYLFESGDMRFSWHVLAPTLRQYEILFDLREFRPI